MYCIHGIASLALLQAPYGMTEGQTHWLIAFTLLTAVAVLIQAVALGAMAFMVVKLLKQVTELTGKLENKVWPLMDKTRQVVDDLVPKIQRVTENVAETSDVYRAKLAEIDSLVTDTANKVKKQSDRLDEMVSSTLTTAGNVAHRVETAVLTPVRQGAALLSGIRAAAETLAHNYSKSTRTPKPVAFEGESIYTGKEDDYHA